MRARLAELWGRVRGEGLIGEGEARIAELLEENAL
jgi:hypothetical protein